MKKIHNWPRNFNFLGIGPSFPRLSSKEGRGTWLHCFTGFWPRDQAFSHRRLYCPGEHCIGVLVILVRMIAFWSSSLDFDTLHCFGPLHYVDPHHYFGHIHSILVIVFGFLLRRWWLNLKLGTSLQMQTSGKEEGSLDSDNVVFLHRILSKLHKRKHLYVFKLES